MSSFNSLHEEQEQQRRIQFVESSTTPTFNRTRAVVRCLVLTVILLLLAINVCIFIVWLALRPRVPVIQIDSLSVSNFSLLHNNLRTDAAVEFRVKNRNWKKRLWFSRFDVLLSYKDYEISKSYFESFKLAKKGETRKNVKFLVDSSIEGKKLGSTAVEMIRKELSFNVSMKGDVFFPSGKSYSKKKSIEVFCGNLKVKFSANGKGKFNTDQKHDCSVHFV